jgi:HAE1 family hydrophobic/amphiphilic exporter-1
VAVLFVFLLSWRITLIAAATLPLTAISTFLFMGLFGETVNLMSMGASPSPSASSSTTPWS